MTIEDFRNQWFCEERKREQAIRAQGKIMEKLLGEYGKDKTFLIIAHRLGTLKYTDNIAVMERGRVVEEGSYDKLMNNSSSVFYRMNKEQKKDETSL